jgi:purine nucleosidase
MFRKAARSEACRVDKVPVLLDTDIGSNIDDALALAYLLKQPRCDLIGITTVTGEPDKRAMIADAVCRAFGRDDVPVHSGAGMPMIVPQRQPRVPQASVLSKWPHRDSFAPNTAVDFLRQTIRSRPGEITLLTVGPLTNAGLLYTLDPQIPGLLKQHVMMGGHYLNMGVGCAPIERNMMGDPHAAASVFAAAVPHMTCIGLDVTSRCRMPAPECRKRFAVGPLRIVGEIAEVWFEGRPRITFHDPLAAAVVFERSFCQYVNGRVDIELQSSPLLGYTALDSNATPAPHRVAVEVAADRFFDEYFAVVAGR